MRVLVSGGRGYVGKGVVSALGALGHEVALVSRQDADDIPTLKYTGVIEPIAVFCEHWRPDAVIHLAADLAKLNTIETTPDLLEANVKLPLFLAQCAVDCGARRFLNISTYSTSLNGVDDSPQTLYAATKRAAEVLLDYYHQSTALKVCTLAFYDVYGPLQPHARFLVALARAVRSGEPFHMTKGEQDICLLHVDDAVSAVLHALGSDEAFADPLRNAFTVCGEEVVKLKDVPARLAQSVGCRTPELVFDMPYRTNEIMTFAPRYPQLVGWRARIKLAEGLRSVLGEQGGLN